MSDSSQPQQLTYQQLPNPFDVYNNFGQIMPAPALTFDPDDEVTLHVKPQQPHSPQPPAALLNALMPMAAPSSAGMFELVRQLLAQADSTGCKNVLSVMIGLTGHDLKQ